MRSVCGSKAWGKEANQPFVHHTHIHPIGGPRNDGMLFGLPPDHCIVPPFATFQCFLPGLCRGPIYQLVVPLLRVRIARPFGFATVHLHQARTSPAGLRSRSSTLARSLSSIVFFFFKKKIRLPFQSAYTFCLYVLLWTVVVAVFAKSASC